MQVLILNGDIDPVVDMHGTEAAVLKMGFEPIAAQLRRPWFFNATATDSAVVLGKPTAWGPTVEAKAAGPQVGGFVTGFDATPANHSEKSARAAFDFRFVTIRNSGHMTPVGPAA